MTKIVMTEKLIGLFRRIDAKGIPEDEIDWDSEMVEMEQEMRIGLCSRCCFAECRCPSPYTGKAMQ